jgi:hypothetical protein
VKKKGRGRCFNVNNVASLTRADLLVEGNALHSAELIESVKQDFTDILVQSLANGHNY